MPAIRCRRSNGRGAVRIAALLAFALLSAAAQAQPAPQPSAPEAEPAPGPADVPESGPGFLEVLGRWLGNSKEAIDSQVRNTQETLGNLGSQATGAAKDAAGAAQKATGTVIGLPIPQAVTGKQLCRVAPNGGADCQPAADTLCKSKGFSGGKSAEIQSSQRCPSRVWIAGRDSNRECRTETFVTRAACQ